MTHSYFGNRGLSKSGLRQRSIIKHRPHVTNDTETAASGAIKFISFIMYPYPAIPHIHVTTNT